jgi:ABC-type transport system substrate-binding protein
VIALQSDAASHTLGELWRHDMEVIGLRTAFRIAQFPENLKAVRAGQVMMWDANSLASQPDGQVELERLYGPAAGGQNIARFHLDAFDDIYRRMLVLPDGPERAALFREAKRLLVAYMPYKIHGHRIVTDLAWPRLVGYRRPLFARDWWQFVDMEPGGPDEGSS